MLFLLAILRYILYQRQVFMLYAKMIYATAKGLFWMGLLLSMKSVQNVQAIRMTVGIAQADMQNKIIFRENLNSCFFNRFSLFGFLFFRLDIPGFFY